MLSPSVAFCCTVFTAMASHCTVQEHLHCQRARKSPLPPSQQTLSPNIPTRPIVLFSETFLLCCNMRFWLLYLGYRHHTAEPSLVEKYDNKQCLLRHLPSCTKPFRGLYGEKREKKMLHKIIPTGEQRAACVSTMSDNPVSQSSLWPQPQPQLL